MENRNVLGLDFGVDFFVHTVLCTVLQYANLKEDCCGHLQIAFFISLTLLDLAALYIRSLDCRVRFELCLGFFPLCN